jgi:hypothetical protein
MSDELTDQDYAYIELIYLEYCEFSIRKEGKVILERNEWANSMLDIGNSFGSSTDFLKNLIRQYKMRKNSSLN